MIEEEGNVTVHIPPGVQHGTTLEVPLQRLGLHNFYLCLHIAVTSWTEHSASAVLAPQHQ